MFRQCDIPVSPFSFNIYQKPIYSMGVHKTSLQYRLTVSFCKVSNSFRIVTWAASENSYIHILNINLPNIIQALLSFILAIFPLSNILFETGETARDRWTVFPDVSGKLAVSAQTCCWFLFTLLQKEDSKSIQICCHTLVHSSLVHAPCLCGEECLWHFGLLIKPEMKILRLLGVVCLSVFHGMYQKRLEWYWFNKTRSGQ